MLLTKWTQGARSWKATEPHFSMQRALAHSPPTARGAWSVCRCDKVQHTEARVNQAQGAAEAGTLLRAQYAVTQGVFWAHCQGKMHACMQQTPAGG
jgi:hypothetical protein